VTAIQVPGCRPRARRSGQLDLARAGWSAVRAEGATDRFPSLSHPSLALVRSGTDLTDDAYLALPEDDQIHVVLMGFLSLVGERLGNEPQVGAPVDRQVKPPPKPRAKRSKARPPG
jgi:hypothetical protein